MPMRGGSLLARRPITFYGKKHNLIGEELFVVEHTGATHSQVGWNIIMCHAMIDRDAVVLGAHEDIGILQDV